MTIKSLERRRPQFPIDLRCRITEMVRCGTLKAERETNSPLEGLIPQMLYVVEGLDLFLKASKVSAEFNVKTTTLDDLLIYIRNVKTLDDGLNDPELKVAVEKLNVVRTAFTDQLYRRGPLSDRYITAVKTLFLDIPEIVSATSRLASGTIHPFIDPSLETLDRVYAELNEISSLELHREFAFRCQHFNLLNEGALLTPREQDDLVTVNTTEQNWFNDRGNYNPINDFSDYITPSLSATVGQLIDQFCSLINVKIVDQEIKKLTKSAINILKNNWTRLVEQIRLLLYITEIHLHAQELSFNVHWRQIFLQVEESDPALEIAIASKLKTFFSENDKNEEQ